MKFVAAYLGVGILLTLAWNTQVQTACGKPLSFPGFIFGAVVMPVLTPITLWEGSKPACDKMTLGGSAAQ